MILKSLSSTPIGDGNRFSEKIMRRHNEDNGEREGGATPDLGTRFLARMQKVVGK